jgi:hypothetical protein
VYNRFTFSVGGPAVLSFPFSLETSIVFQVIAYSVWHISLSVSLLSENSEKKEVGTGGTGTGKVGSRTVEGRTKRGFETFYKSGGRL